VSTTATDPAIERALASLTVPGVLVGHRLIQPDDALALLPSEAVAFARSVEKVKRASGAVRIVARALLVRLGEAPRAITKSASGAPAWPAGVIGSLAHDDRVAIAALAKRGAVTAIGVDVEPAQALTADLLPIVATPRELAELRGDGVRARALFAIKEAVYKAVNPLDGMFLEHHDVEVDFAASTAVTRSGRTIRFDLAEASHFVALAWL
jgi:4'-phosphopantetheinyl transferase EntD